jgi:hypothetical protein
VKALDWHHVQVGLFVLRNRRTIPLFDLCVALAHDENIAIQAMAHGILSEWANSMPGDE